MEWTTLTTDDLADAMTATELGKFTGAAVDATAILGNLVAEVRGMIASHPTNSLSADATKIPPSMKGHALAIARWRVLTAIPGYQPGNAREKEYDTATEYFRQVARGLIRPEGADDAQATEAPGEKPAGVDWTAPGGRTGRTKMDGL